jgi:hypothetical protein
VTLRVPLEFHSTYGKPRYVDVEAYGDYDEQVQIIVQGETDDEEPTERVLSAAEARSLAAALMHYAVEAEK